jgi:hypothetical protein
LYHADPTKNQRKDLHDWYLTCRLLRGRISS